jgi:hypothetical protein
MVGTRTKKEAKEIVGSDRKKAQATSSTIT